MIKEASTVAVVWSVTLTVYGLKLLKGVQDINAMLGLGLVMVSTGGGFTTSKLKNAADEKLVEASLGAEEQRSKIAMKDLIKLLAMVLILKMNDCFGVIFINFIYPNVTSSRITASYPFTTSNRYVCPLVSPLIIVDVLLVVKEVMVLKAVKSVTVTA